MSTPTLSPKQQARVDDLEQLTTDTLEKLAQELAEGQPEAFIELLTFYAKFWRYSLRNSLLIKQQCPGATRVASYALWQKLGMQVEQGQAAIWIFAPLLAKKKDPATGEEAEKLLGYRPVPVFDVSQLNAESQAKIPTLDHPLPDDRTEQWEALKERCRERDIRIFEMRLPGGVQGSCEESGRIKIHEKLDSRTKILVCAHELAHLKGHWGEQAKGLSYADAEVQAEGCSVVIGALLGIDHPTARSYILSWKGEAESLRGHLQAIQKLVRQVAEIFGINEKEAQQEAA